MLKLRRFSKLLPIVLIASIFLTACEVPDISKFTEQSTEMTRGIRKGIKDNESLIKTASERDDLYGPQTIKTLKADLKRYKTATKPTVDALDALDAYLEALNALAQANKKSGENSAAVVNSVTNLVTAVTGFSAAGSVVNIATGLVTLAEQFRTAKDFKKRVTLAAEIVEGVHPVRDSDGKPKKDKDGRVIFVRNCSADAKGPITDAGNTIKRIAEPILKGLSDGEAERLSKVPAEEKWETLNSWGKFKGTEFREIQTAEQTVDNYGCGVIDFIKFNIEDLKSINEDISRSLLDNIREKDSTVVIFHDNLVKGREDIQKKLANIQVAKNLVPIINEYVALNADSQRIVSRKITFKQTLDDLFLLDPPLKATVLDSLINCGETKCGKIVELLNKPGSASCDAACEKSLKDGFNDMARAQFDSSTALILRILEVRRGELNGEDERNRSDLERIAPKYDAVMAEIASIKTKRDQLDALFNSSNSALDSWSEAHANLRVTVNTKKPLTVAKLASKVKEIWSIINPATT